MGCGISRFDPRHHHHGLHRRSPTTESIGDDDHSDINITNNGSRLLFFAYHGEEGSRQSVSSPLSQIHLKNITQMELPVIQGNVGRRKAEACSGAAGDHNPNLERKSDAELFIGGEEDLEEDYDGRLSSYNNNIEDFNGINGACPLFMGSPSFREYCFVGCHDDNLIKSSVHIKDIGNNCSKDREGDISIRASDEGCAGSSDSGSVGVKKTKGSGRRLRKGGSTTANQRHRGGAVRRSLMNVASCYHPPPHNHNHNTLPSPSPSTPNRPIPTAPAANYQNHTN